ncbi:putative thiamine transport system substrate-binding protein [Rhodovulum imhoffii]|uniref:Putative thiamine transport system substrate-binding protein n=1 Tax=Rhodovulum imhoffii TaxID=365340 RepID=A0A2T5BR84_9RHOB|nr:ABC transporter substrate-binding protein [Rhodovulum imhoffii]MBK5934420.1 ABC transporter substrate-binding protein [Rhodovulum imhoffii]PTN01766.1 putative thiamine transport system substrate-binding protein [Rhodovulum imhoffii]
MRLTFLIAALFALPLRADPDPTDWTAVLEDARGQTVYWHAWGGATATNDFIRWVAQQVDDRFGVRLTHVKLADTADAVSRVIAEKNAGKTDGGAVDLIWINGANFAAMKENGLLYGPWAEDLPNRRYVDITDRATTHDFTVPTEGYESPWAKAQVVFYHDTARLPAPPVSMPALLNWARQTPGRFTYPQPPDFLGTTFLKQALYELTPDPAALQSAAGENYDTATAPLWAFLDDLTPHLWRQGRAYPQTGPRQLQLMADGEIDLAISFSPGEASTAIASGQLPDTVRTFVLERGTIGNASFVAIPFNASAKAGAMVVADFLLSPMAQAHAQDPVVLGYGTVLALDKLPAPDRARFTALELGIATLPPEALGPTLPEPHPSWTTRIEQDWARRFGG